MIRNFEFINMAPNGKASTGKRKPRNKQTKLHLLFDEAKRKDFLCGFKKRKDERKRKGREQLERKIKEERKQLLQERKETLLKMFQQQQTIPEMESIVEPVTYDLESHTVTITSINDVDFQGKNNLLLGENKDCESESGENEDSNTADTATKCKAAILKDKSKKVAPSKTAKMKQKLQQKKAQSKVKKKKKILRKRDKHRSKHTPKI